MMIGLNLHHNLYLWDYVFWPILDDSVTLCLLIISSMH